MLSNTNIKSGQYSDMKIEVEEITNATSMGELERKAVIKSLLNLHSFINLQYFNKIIKS